MDDKTAEELAELTADLIMVIGQMRRVGGHTEAGSVHRGTEFAILDTILRHKRKTVPEIAAWRGVARQTVQTVVNKLIDGGVLAYAPNPAHKSSRIIEVTAQGLNNYQSNKQSMKSIYQRLNPKLRRGDTAATLRVMNVIAETWRIADSEDDEAEPADGRVRASA
jgi:DNA-binding MarR family transcriptional regulator